MKKEEFMLLIIVLLAVVSPQFAVRVALQWSPQPLTTLQSYGAVPNGRRVRVSIGTETDNFDEFLTLCRSRLGLDPNIAVSLYNPMESVRITEIEVSIHPPNQQKGLFHCNSSTPNDVTGVGRQSPIHTSTLHENHQKRETRHWDIPRGSEGALVGPCRRASGRRVQTLLPSRACTTGTRPHRGVLAPLMDRHQFLSRSHPMDKIRDHQVRRVGLP